MKQRTASGKGLPRLKRHRRPVAAILAALSVAFGLASVRPLDPAGVQVLAAARDLPGGTALRRQDVRSVVLPPTAVPDGALRDRVAGRVLTGPIRRGEVITDARLVSGGLLKGYGPGVVAAPVRVADAATIRLLRPGDRVDVLTNGTAPDLGTDGFVPDIPGTSTPRPEAALPQTPATPSPGQTEAPPRTPAGPPPDRTKTPPQASAVPDRGRLHVRSGDHHVQPVGASRPASGLGRAVAYQQSGIRSSGLGLPRRACPATGESVGGWGLAARVHLGERVTGRAGPVGDRVFRAVRGLPPVTVRFPDARVVAAAVPVIAVLRDDSETGGQGGLVVLATSREQAAALAGAAGTRLSVTIVGD